MPRRLQAKKTIIDESKEAVERPVTASRENVAVLSAEGNDMEMGREIRWLQALLVGPVWLPFYPTESWQVHRFCGCTEGASGGLLGWGHLGVAASHSYEPPNGWSNSVEY